MGVRLYESAYLPSEFRTSQPRLYALIRFAEIQQSRMQLHASNYTVSTVPAPVIATNT